MSRKSISRKYSKKEKASKEWPLVIYVWIVGLALVGYFVARVGLLGVPHPFHWLSGVVGGVIGVGVGWLWYRWKGDII